MTKFSRKLLSSLLVFAFVFQLFSPALPSVWAQAHKEATDEAVAEFRTVYDDIMALEPLELPGLASFAVGFCDAWNEFTDWCCHIGESAEQRKKRREEEGYQKYKEEIEEANRKIVELQAEAKSTMEMLENGDADLDAMSSAVNDCRSMTESGGALAVYQEALCETGQELVDFGSTLGTIGSTLSAIAAIVVAVGVFFPPILAVSPVLEGVALALNIAGPVIEGAGNSLLTIGTKGITDTSQMVNEIALEGVLTGTSALVGASGMGAGGKIFANGTIGSIREINRTGATGSDAVGIALNNYGSAAVSQAVGAVWDANATSMAGGDPMSGLVLDAVKPFGTDYIKQEVSSYTPKFTPGLGNAGGTW